MKRTFISMLFAILATAVIGSAQTTEFTYQGSLKDGSAPANGSYDFEFRIFDAVTGGNQIGAVATRNSVEVVNGTFSVTLNFGNQFPGADRFLEIKVRVAGGGAYTLLDPRQKLSSSPYSVKSLTSDLASNSQNLGGVAASQYVQTTDSRLTDDRNPLPNSPNYIRNSQTTQPNSNFAISGSGSIGGSATVGTNLNVSGNGLFLGDVTILGSLNSNGSDTGYLQNRTTVQPGTTNFNINGTGVLGGNLRAANVNALSGFQLNSTRVLHVTGTGNLFAGYGAGDNNTGTSNTFVGIFAGVANSTGSSNTFMGRNAGVLNTTGGNNSIFGDRAGDVNSTGSFNSFFGVSAGGSNVGSSYNSFFGYQAGVNNTSSSNAFFGAGAGTSNTSGNGNSFLGRTSGSLTTTGIGNTFLGNDAGFTNVTGSNNTAIGASADLFSSDYSYATAIGAGSMAVSSNSISLGRQDGSDLVRIPGSVIISGTMSVLTLSSAGSTAVCLNIFSRLGSCSSSLRYKTNIAGFTSGLDLINRLRPITFDWKEGGMHDLGLGAEDVEAIEPLLVTYNKDGQVEGVKYDRVGVVLINAVKEQQILLDEQNRKLETQENRIEQLKEQVRLLTNVICSTQKGLQICKEQK